MTAADRQRLYLRLRDELTARARTSEEYEAAVREAARRAGV